MKNSGKPKKALPIEEIEEMAARGEDVTQYFNFKGATMHPGFGKLERAEKSKNIQRVNVDLAQGMLKELDSISEENNVPRQSLIKTMLREAIDRYFSKKQARKAI
jgi:hypothetical protein